MNLLTYPSLVESPFIIVTIGDYTFGNMRSKGEMYNNGLHVSYPNYLKSLNVKKVNGTVNTYTLVMEYAIRAGDDPNLLDRVFSTISDKRIIKVSYGDWKVPSFIYKEEEVLVTKVQSRMDFSGAKITYTVTGTSASYVMLGTKYTFPAYTSKKPSNVIRDILMCKAYGITDIFPGMKDSKLVSDEHLIPTDDAEVKIEQKTTDILSYLNYLVACMQEQTPSNKKDASNNIEMYRFNIVDDITSKMGGAYFKITKIAKDASLYAVDSPKVYEVDVGYPTNEFVTSFTMNSDEQWAILYNYAGSVAQSEYVYKINSQGQMETVYSPALTTSSTLHYTTAAEQSWWSDVTNFPISATLTLKGLLRPAMLMEYVRINVLFYGQKHISSGLYFITKQEDIIDANGYRTTLTLTRQPTSEG